jgi:hypothetical protein
MCMIGSFLLILRLEFELSFDNSGSNGSKKTVLIKFLFTRRYIEGQKPCSREHYSHHRSFVAVVVFVLDGTSSRDFA